MTEFSKEDPEGELPRPPETVGLLSFAKYGDRSESSCTTSPENLRKPRRFSWRTHSCVPRRDSSRRLPESSPESGVDMSVEAAGTSACATALVAAPLLCGAGYQPAHAGIAICRHTTRPSIEAREQGATDAERCSLEASRSCRSAAERQAPRSHRALRRTCSRCKAGLA